MGARDALQLVLDLFGPRPPRSPAAKAPLRHAAPPPAPDAVSVEYSSRRRRGWRLVRIDGRWVCQAPSALRDAPVEVHDDLQAWIRAALKPHPGSRARRREIERRIFAWMAPVVPDRMPQARSQGASLDLQELFQRLNAEHFDGQLRAVVRWSPRIGGLSTHQQLRTRDGVRHLITISRAYDGRDVPEVAVAGVLFHEMCHIAHPPKPGRGSRRMVHHKEFRQAERRFPGWEEWRDWEGRNLARRVRRLERP